MHRLHRRPRRRRLHRREPAPSRRSAIVVASPSPPPRRPTRHRPPRAPRAVGLGGAARRPAPPSGRASSSLPARHQLPLALAGAWAPRAAASLQPVGRAQIPRRHRVDARPRRRQRASFVTRPFAGPDEPVGRPCSGRARRAATGGCFCARAANGDRGCGVEGGEAQEEEEHGTSRHHHARGDLEPELRCNDSVRAGCTRAATEPKSTTEPESTLCSQPSSQAFRPFCNASRAYRLGLGMAALGRPGYISLGHADEPGERGVENARARARGPRRRVRAEPPLFRLRASCRPPRLRGVLARDAARRRRRHLRLEMGLRVPGLARERRRGRGARGQIPHARAV